MILLFLCHTLENKELDEGDCEAEKSTACHADTAVVHASYNTEESNETNGAESSLFDSHGNCAGEECYDGADDGNELVACGNGVVICNYYRSVRLLIVCVHIFTYLSNFGIYISKFLDLELNFLNLVKFLPL